jgi:superfamily I DNA/RNA helicase
MDSSAFARIANKPKRGIGEKSIGLIENYAAAREIDVILACAHGEEYFRDSELASAVRGLHVAYGMDTTGKSVADILAECVQRSDYNRYLLESERDDKVKMDERIRNVQELINSIALFCQDQPDATVAGYLQYITLLTNKDDKDNQDAVRLMSLHASKGLEFDVVFMVGVENGMLPHKKAVDERPEAGLTEERRLCYVGMTRARQQLFVSCCLQRQSGFQRGKAVKFETRRPSQFLVEAGLMTMDDYNRNPRPSLVS